MGLIKAWQMGIKQGKRTDSRSMVCFFETCEVFDESFCTCWMSAHDNMKHMTWCVDSGLIKFLSNADFCHEMKSVSCCFVRFFNMFDICLTWFIEFCFLKFRLYRKRCCLIHSL